MFDVWVRFTKKTKWHRLTTVANLNEAWESQNWIQREYPMSAVRLSRIKVSVSRVDISDLCGND